MSTPEKIYVIVGYTYDYDSSHSWLVGALADKQAAEEHADKARRRAGEIYDLCGDNLDSLSSYVNEFDVNMAIYWSLPNYEVKELGWL